MSRLNNILIPLLLFCSSCSKDATEYVLSGDFNMSVGGNLPEMEIAGVEDCPETKAATAYTVRIKWAAGDKLSVINLTTGKILGGTLSANSTGYSTTFSGTLNGTVSRGDVIAYVYPASFNTVEEVFTSKDVDFSSQQGTMNNVPLCAYSIVTVNDPSFTNVQLDFVYSMSYIMTGISDMPASSTIKYIDIVGISNKYTLRINDAHNGLAFVAEQGTIRLSPGQAASSSGARTLYFSFPQSPKNTARVILLTTDQTEFSTYFPSSALQDGYAYNTNVSGFLKDDMRFEDARMDEYAHKHFDSNGDGRLTLVEIAGIKQFPSQTTYPLPYGLTRFNELEYFYSLTDLPSFKNMTQLGEVTIPRQTTNIPDEMFLGCNSLTKVVMSPLSPPSLGNNVFLGAYTNYSIVVPDGSLETYQQADGWRECATHIRTTAGTSDSNVDIGLEDEDMEGEDINLTI